VKKEEIHVDDWKIKKALREKKGQSSFNFGCNTLTEQLPKEFNQVEHPIVLAGFCCPRICTHGAASEQWL